MAQDAEFHDRESPDLESPGLESLYDRYLDDSLLGEPEDPAAFFARHPGVDATGRERIQTLYDVLTRADDGRDEGEDALPYERLGGYRLLRRIGSGSMGAIFLAEQASLGRLVALKILRPELAASRSAMKRFEREARVIAKLDHPNVVTLHELGEDAGTHFLVMALVPGRSLDKLLLRGRPALDRTLGWIEQCARGLQAAHEEGIVHRDVKPSNILITPDDRAVLCDFGMAHLAGADASRLTQTFAGSPSYAAPEQVDSKNRDVDGRTDVYGLGATLYECTTGHLPVRGKSLEEIFQKILREDPLPPRRFNPELPADVETATMKAMAKRPADRYATAGALADDLQRIALNRRILARRPPPWRRVRRWARRRPAQAAILSMSLAVLLCVAGAMGWSTHAHAEQRRVEAAGLVRDAHAKYGEYRETRRRYRGLLLRHTGLARRTKEGYLSDDRYRELEEVQAKVDRIQRLQQARFYETLEMLRRAERLDPEVPCSDHVRAALYLERMEEAFDAEDAAGAEMFRQLVNKHDPSGVLTERKRISARVTLRTEPAGAATYWFREGELHRFGGTRERRMVPVPLDVDPARLPAWWTKGGFALRVRADAPPLRRGDVIVAVNGEAVRRGVLLDRPYQGLPRGARLQEFKAIADLEELDPETPRSFLFDAGPIECRPGELPVAPIERVAAAGGLLATVWRSGEELEVMLPPGLDLRLTAAPLLAMPSNRGGDTPVGARELEPGAYRVLVRHKDRRDLVVSLSLQPGERFERTILLPPLRAGPTGFVPVSAPDPFWIMEHEITCAEFLTFLNDTRHIADWPVDDTGRYRLADGAQPDWPAVRVSYLDALAYARWKGAGFALPTMEQWTYAATGGQARTYVFGNVWRPRWAKSCFSRPRAQIEPVMRYAIDESIFGVYDLTGSVSEWVDHWFDEGRALKWAAGSSWGYGDPQLFRVEGGTGAAVDHRCETLGFRLVWRPAGRAEATDGPR